MAAIVLTLGLGTSGCQTMAEIDPTGLLSDDDAPPDSQFPTDSTQQAAADASTTHAGPSQPSGAPGCTRYHGPGRHHPAGRRCRQPGSVQRRCAACGARKPRPPPPAATDAAATKQALASSAAPARAAQDAPPTTNDDVPPTAGSAPGQPARRCTGCCASPPARRVGRPAARPRGCARSGPRPLLWPHLKRLLRPLRLPSVPLSSLPPPGAEPAVPAVPMTAGARACHGQTRPMHNWVSNLRRRRH